MEGVWFVLFILSAIASGFAQRALILAVEAADAAEPRLFQAFPEEVYARPSRLFQTTAKWWRRWFGHLIHRHPDPDVEGARKTALFWAIALLVSFVLFAAS